jgi:hypothetical protein
MADLDQQAEARRLSLIFAALAAGWAVIWAFYIAQWLAPDHVLPKVNGGASVAASGFWLVLILFFAALADILRLQILGAYLESLMLRLVTSGFFRWRWMPLVALLAGIVFARVFWTQLWPGR